MGVGGGTEGQNGTDADTETEGDWEGQSHRGKRGNRGGKIQEIL